MHTVPYFQQKYFRAHRLAISLLFGLPGGCALFAHDISLYWIIWQGSSVTCYGRSFFHPFLVLLSMVQANVVHHGREIGCLALAFAHVLVLTFSLFMA